MNDGEVFFENTPTETKLTIYPAHTITYHYNLYYRPVEPPCRQLTERDLIWCLPIPLHLKNQVPLKTYATVHTFQQLYFTLQAKLTEQPTGSPF